MEVRTEIGKRFQSRGALKQNALSAADLNVPVHGETACRTVYGDSETRYNTYQTTQLT